jgi:short-subunit dehydrogenase
VRERRVDNAGFAAAGPVETVTEAETRRQFDVNVFGLLHVTRAVLPGMRRRRAGLVVNVSSVVGRVSFPGTGVYSASKHAVEALSDALRAEVKPFGIGVVVVEPAFVRTEITQTPTADGALAEGAYRALADATTAYLRREVERGATRTTWRRSSCGSSTRADRGRATRSRRAARASWASWRACRTASGMP